MGKTIAIDRLESELREIVEAELGVDAVEITSNASFTDDLGADSIDTTELVMAVEDKYKVEISDDDIDDLNTFGKLVDYVQRKLTRAA